VHTGPNADQLELQAAAREVLRKSCPSTLVRQAYSDPRAWQDLWKTAVQMGWTQLALRGIGPDDLGLTTLDLVLTLEACGGALAPIPLISSIGVAAGAVRTLGPGALDLLTDLADGSVATLAAQPTGQRLPGVPLTLDDAGRVHGSALCVPDAVHADLLVALCSSADRTALAIVPIGDGVLIEPADSADPSRPLAVVTVDARAVESAIVDLEQAIAPGLLALAAELVGTAHGALDMAVEHAKTRRQFDRVIGSYQGVKHALADNYVAVERARALVYGAAALLDEAPAGPRLWDACALAKAAANDAALACTRTAVQVLGALGQTWEHDIHLYLRRAWVSAALFGDSSSLYHAVGRRYMSGGAA